MEFILFAFIAFVGWGSGDIFGGIVSRKIKGYSASFWFYLFSFLIGSFMLPFFWYQLSGIRQQMWVIMIGLNFLLPVASVLFYEGLRIGNASLVGTIGSAFAALTVVLSVIFLGDKLTVFQIIPIVIIFAGLILSSLELKSFKIKNIFADKGVPYALGAMVLWGIFFTFIRIPIREVGWFWPSYLNLLGVPLIWLYMRFKKIKLEKLSGFKMTMFAFLSSLLVMVAAYSYNFAVMKGETSIVAPIAGSYPVLYVILSRFVFKDRLTKQQIMGIVVTLLGIVILSFLGG